MSLALVLALSAASASDARVAFGAQLETQGRGILDLGWRRGPLSVQLFTDTLDLRLTEQRDRGRWSLGVRAASFAAGMWITPWANGAPDLARAQQASYFGPDAELQRYLPGGVHVGGAGFFRPHRFRPLGASTLRLPDTYWGRAQLVAGVWRDDGRRQARLSVGADATTPGRIAPHVFGDALWRIDRPVTPVVELHAGLAENQDDITATRIGGLTPYTLPFAGAAWAELWVEDYATARVGGRIERGQFHAGAVMDAGVWTLPGITTIDRVEGGAALGFAGVAGWRDRAAFAELAAGFSPSLPRAEGVWPVPVYLRVGSDWVGL